MQNCLAIGQGVKSLDKKKRRGGRGSTSPLCQFKGLKQKLQISTLMACGK